MQQTSLLQKSLTAKLKQIYEPKTETVRIPGKKRTVEETIQETKTVKETIVRPRPYWVPLLIFGAGIIALVSFFGMGSEEYGYYSAIGATVLAVIIGLALYSTRKVEQSKTVPFERTIQKEVQDEDTFEDRIVQGRYKVIEIGKGKMNFSAQMINHNMILVADDPDLTVQSLKYPYLKNDQEVKDKYIALRQDAENVPYVLGTDQEEFDTKPRTTYGGTIRLKGLERKVMSHFQFIDSECKSRESESFNFSSLQDQKLLSYLVKSGDEANNEEIRTLSNKVHSSQGVETDEMVQQWLDFWNQANKLFNNLRIKSLSDEISLEFLQLGRVTNYSCFNFYCPECNKDIMDDFAKRNYSVQSKSVNSELYFSKNTKCTVNDDRETWTCPACEKQMSTVIPVHKTLNEVFFPVFDKLMEENKVQREQSNSEVRKKEIEFRNEMKKEIDKMYFDNISGILALRDDMDRMKAEIDGELKAIDLMQDLGQRNLKSQSEVIHEINKINNQIREKVQEKIVAVINQVDSYMQGEMNAFADKMDKLSKAHKINMQKRDAVYQGILDETRNQTAQLGELGKKMDESNSLSQEQINTSQQGFSAVYDQLGQLNQSVQVGNHINAATAKRLGVDLKDQKERKAVHGMVSDLKSNNQ